MKKKQYYIGALMVGGLLLAATGAQAFGGVLPLDAFKNFSSSEQSAIEKAFTIREKAEAEAQAVLSDAGITEMEIHDAMRSYGEQKRKVIDDALEAGDFAAYKEAVSGTPMADEITEATFDKLVEAHSYMKDGDIEKAKETMDGLDIKMPMAGKGHGPMGGAPGRFLPTKNN
jgi:hypothetical protein